MAENTGDWRLIWQDEFDGPAGSPPDPARWGHNLGGRGWGNAEWQTYTDSTENAALDGAGHLVITARPIEPEAGDCWYGPCRYTSARLSTRDKFSVKHGRIEARLKLPTGQGLWPAFWMLGSDHAEVGWPTCGEIDIMENLGHQPHTVHGTLHGPGYSGVNAINKSMEVAEALPDHFHVFGVEWAPDVLHWHVDGQRFHTVTPADVGGNPWVFEHEFFILLNLAVGGYWPGYPDETTVFPQSLHADWVRVYQQD